MTEIQSQVIQIDHQPYKIQIKRAKHLTFEAPRLVIVAYQPNETAAELLKLCIAAIRKYTPVPYELWIVDNNSPEEYSRWLLDDNGINFIHNQTEPIPQKGYSFLNKLLKRTGQRRWGSYANAIALEIAARLIDPQTRYLMTLHMDSLPCHPEWLPFLQSKIDSGYGAAGARMDKIRTEEGVLHVLGYMLDFQLFRQLNLDFMPDLPQHDVGDLVTINIRQAGYPIFACRNTFTDPESMEIIPNDSPFRDLDVDRAFDDAGNVIFLHLGRGIRKSTDSQFNSNSLEKWFDFARIHLEI